MRFEGIFAVCAMRAVGTEEGFLPRVNQQVTLELLFPRYARERVATNAT